MTQEEKTAGKRPLSETVLRLIGAVLAGGINFRIMLFWAGEIRSDKAQIFIALNVASTLISAFIGYFFTGWITADSRARIGAGTGAIAGSLIGAINGTCVFPGGGTIIGTLIGAVAGVGCGYVMASVAQGLALGLKAKKQPERPGSPHTPSPR